MRIMRIFLALSIGLIVTLPAAAVTGLPNEVPDEILEQAETSFIFIFKDTVRSGEIRGLAHQLATAKNGSLRHIFSKAIKGFSATISSKGAAAIANNPHIAYYEPNRIVWAADMREEPQPRPRPGPGHEDDGDDDDDGESLQITPWGIERVGGPVDGSGLHAWIIDSGIDLDHPDLNVGYGINFVDIGLEQTPDDAYGHGTHVAGTVAAIDNKIDVIGVSPNATVHPVRVLAKSGFGTADWIVAGIDYVAANALAGDCANMSLGGLGHQESIHDAVLGAANLGILFSVAAGNDGEDAEDYEPAHVEHPNVYTISAIDNEDVFASFSNWGDPVDFAAPGVDILSTQMGGGTTEKSGTSMAAPHVCGILLHMAPPNTDGYAIDDPDKDPDPIAHF